MNDNDVRKSTLVDYRPGVESDRAFIMATWLRGLRFGNSWYRLIDADTYFKVYHAVIERMLEQPNIKIVVACLKDDPEVILGFTVFSAERLHWVYVKQAWRNIGIARAIVPTDITTVSHLTEVGKSLLIKKKLLFNPFFLI